MVGPPGRVGPFGTVGRGPVGGGGGPVAGRHPTAETVKTRPVTAAPPNRTAPRPMRFPSSRDMTTPSCWLPSSRDPDRDRGRTLNRSSSGGNLQLHCPERHIPMVMELDVAVMDRERPAGTTGRTSGHR